MLLSLKNGLMLISGCPLSLFYRNILVRKNRLALTTILYLGVVKRICIGVSRATNSALSVNVISCLYND